MPDDIRGQCLCGSIRFRVARSELANVVICHCGMCRRWHGHVGAYADAPRTAVTLEASADLAWFQSSNFARRGFCRTCGSSLFWDAPERTTISITAGALDAPAGLTTVLQIFTGHCGDYYPIDTAIPIRSEPSPSS
jgi:hypothetical protein